MPASTRPGMGAVPFDGGTTFRVWAPFTTSVAVAGNFNDWDPAAMPLASEGNGYWSADIAGVRIGDEYKFVLRSAARPGLLWKNDPYAAALTSAAGNSIIATTDFAWRCTDYATPPWNELVIYELHVGTFLFEHDPGDPARAGRRGNFETVISKLDELRHLGINAIQVMPVDEFPGDRSWGYNPADIFAIEETYGGPAGLRRLVDEAHRRGIAVIFDVVYNHLGPEDLDLWQFDGWNEEGWGGIYFYNGWPRRKTPWGDTRPDYGRGEVRQFLRDNALWWLEPHFIDGLRWDATGWIRNVWGSNNDPANDIPEGWTLMQWINSEIRRRQPWKITIAEDMQDNEWLTREVEAGGAGFGAQWGAGFMHTLRGQLVAVEDGARSMPALAAAIAQRFNGDAFRRILYTESHDEAATELRLPEAIWPGHADSFFAQKRSTLGAALVLTAPGIPMIFMGQEFLESGAWSDAHELDWSKAERFAGIRALYRDLIRLRRNESDRTRGLKGQHVNIHHVNNADKVIAFHRWDRGGPRDDVVIIANLANRGYDAYRVGLPRGGWWQVRFNGDWCGYSAAFTDHPSVDTRAEPGGSDGMPFSANIGLGPYTAIILSQES